jgi:RNA polymerase sigma-70 factor (ECF subfamily)
MTNTEIFNQYHKLVFGQVMKMVKNYHDAQDVTQNVFRKIVSLNAKESTRFDVEKSAIGTWVRTVVVSVVLDFFKTNHQDRFMQVSDYVNKEGDEFFQFETPSNKTPEKIMVEDEMKTRIIKAFRGLKPKYRKMATMYFMNELSYDEIATQVNVPIGTVKGMLSRARKELQKELKGMYTFKAVREPEVALS